MEEKDGKTWDSEKSIYGSGSINKAEVKLQIDNFDPEDDCDSYTYRFEIALRLFNVSSDNIKRDLLLTKVRAITFKMLVDYFSLEKAGDQTYDSIVAALNEYYIQGCSAIGEKSFSPIRSPEPALKISFSMRVREDGESIISYMNALKGIAAKCSFGQSLDERLRDQLILAINNPQWQKELVRVHSDVKCKLKEVEGTAKNFENVEKTRE